MRRIGIVAVSHPALGGTFQYTLSMIDALRRIPGNEYIIYTTGSNKFYNDIGLPIVRLPSAARTILGYATAAFLPTLRLFSEVDKLISPIYTTRLLASRRPFAMTIHDLQERYYPENFSLAQRVWRHISNRALSRAATRVLCESTHVRDDIIRFLGIADSKISVIPAPPVSAFLPEHLDAIALERAAARLNLPDQFLFYPAQFFPHKNHMRLIEAFALVERQYPGCRLYLTGQARYEHHKVMVRVAELGLADRVIHLGYVDTSLLAAVYARATLVVIPTLFESISIPAYEAFRLGVPVCISNVVGLPAQVGDAAVLFDPFSVNDIAAKITATLGNHELRRRLVVNGEARIGALTPEWYAAQLKTVLDDLEQ
jgi:glycosyltransferase involved in cell wall biosynthesis